LSVDGIIVAASITLLAESQALQAFTIYFDGRIPTP
jgi:hypothetical protein